MERSDFPLLSQIPMSRRRALGGCLGLASVLGGSPVRAVADHVWTPIKHAGRDYLPLEQVGSFYGLGGVSRNGQGFAIGAAGGVLRGQSSSREFWISRVKFILSFPVLEVERELCISRVDLVKLVEPVLRPSKIQGAELVDTVVLDPGHGGSDNGASGPAGFEKTHTLDVCVRAAQLLWRAGYKVVMTRTADEFVPLEMRAKVANRHPRSLFVSVHFNSGENGTGVETYALSPRGVPSMASDGTRVSEIALYPGNARDAENSALATATHAALVAGCGLADRGVKRARFLVIREAAVPGVLMEAGFLSNPEDSRWIASPWYRQQVAGAILQGVRNYRRAVGVGAA
jgi:N-acetylmuramoyl-L-alanine amidase